MTERIVSYFRKIAPKQGIFIAVGSGKSVKDVMAHASLEIVRDSPGLYKKRIPPPPGVES
jgi:hypothetical protein